KRIQTEVGLTFVHVTHDQEEAMTMADTVAVMNQGRIEQMGPPEVLYDLPKTKFVANFVGQSNMGEGTITGTDGDFLVAEVYGSTVRIRKDRTTVQNGNLVFGVRPEKVKVSRTKPEGIGNDVRGIVKDVSFIGVATSYLLEMPSGTTWSVYEQNLDLDRIDLKPGDEAWMVWDAGHAFGVDLEGEQS
ncbi:MAG: TOBE domain-containing protein, partial [Nocardioidaceae bacterium]|nr:TOBE domain-containing protein [Nocardioidaceae bacterium]